MASGAGTSAPPFGKLRPISGAEVQLRYFDVTPAEQRKRLDQRHAKEPHTTWRMSDVELAEWAAIITIPTRGELDGSEPIDDPPAGFATWDERAGIAGRHRSPETSLPALIWIRSATCA